MPKTHEQVREEFLNDPEIRREYEALGPSFDLIRAITTLRTDAGLTQGQLAERIGSNQTYIARIENKPANITLKTLARLAGALGADVEIHFVPDGERPPLVVRVPARQLVAQNLVDRFE